MHACTVHKLRERRLTGGAQFRAATYFRAASRLRAQLRATSRLSWAAFHPEQTEQIIPVVRPAAAKSEECSKHEVEATRVNEILAGAQEQPTPASLMMAGNNQGQAPAS